MTTPTPPESPERSPSNLARLQKEFQDAAKDAGTILPKELLTDLVEIAVCECIELRDRIANRIIQTLIDRGDGATSEQLEQLAYVVDFNFETPDGYIDVIPPPELPKPKLKALKRI